VAATGVVEVGQQGEAPLVHLGHAAVEDGTDQRRLGPEVVVGGGVVALPGGRRDLAQGHGVDAVLAEEPFGGIDESELGVGHGRRLKQSL
jgi:hypothetical protein